MHQPYNQGCFVTLVVNRVNNEHFSEVRTLRVTLLWQLVSLQNHNVFARPLTELILLIVEVEQRVSDVWPVSVLPPQHVDCIKH